MLLTLLIASAAFGQNAAVTGTVTDPSGAQVIGSSVIALNVDTGVANTSNALASPTDYVDVSFSANAGTPYTLWLRLQALNNSKFNDSVWVQFSDAPAGATNTLCLSRSLRTPYARCCAAASPARIALTQ